MSFNITKVFNFIKYLSQEDMEAVNRYSSYWRRISPKTDLDIVKRWVFAFMSIRASWRYNVKSYLMISDILDRSNGYLCYTANKDGKPTDEENDWLMDTIVRSKVGLHNNRYSGLVKFDSLYRAGSELIKPEFNADLVSARDKLLKELKFIGITKISFAFELCYPDKCNVICLDTHLLRLFEYNKQAVSKTDYLKMEEYWCNIADKYNVNPVMARHIYWDRRQPLPQKSTRYWSYVFEKDVSINTASPYNRNKLQCYKATNFRNWLSHK